MAVKRFFLDTEFAEDGRVIDLISIGLVCEDGRELYTESLDANLKAANDWVKQNVVPQLWRWQKGNHWYRDGGFGGLLTRGNIRRCVQDFIGEVTNPGQVEIWGYYADYDWIAFCQLFGRMVDLPSGYPMYCRDLKQWSEQLGSPKLPEHVEGEHHALLDARWNKQAWEFLSHLDLKRKPPDSSVGIYDEGPKEFIEEDK